MLTDLLKWGVRRTDQPGVVAGRAIGHVDELAIGSKALPRFLNVLARRSAPVLLDLGPVVGTNVEFFGNRLGCKLYIEDMLAAIDRHRREGTLPALAASLDSHFQRGEGSVDGVLCWDCFDFLDKASAQALAHQIVRLVRPGGVVMGLFCTSSVARSGYTKYEIVDDNNLRHRSRAGAGGVRQALPNRDIIRMFDGMVVSESFLLKNNTRELLLRKA